MNFQVKSYQVALVGLRYMEDFRMVLKSWRNQQFDIHWDNRVYQRWDYKIICLKIINMARLVAGHLYIYCR